MPSYLPFCWEKVNLPLDSVGVPFCHIAAIQLLVVRAVRAYLLAEGDVKVDPERVDILELGAELPARWDSPREKDLFFSGQ